MGEDLILKDECSLSSKEEMKTFPTPLRSRKKKC